MITQHSVDLMKDCVEELWLLTLKNMTVLLEYENIWIY